jgi:tetratricopeptide (TPR) repeat protein
MPTQFLLDEDDIKELTKLMLVMIETQESRKQLCRELGINPQEVSFIIGTSDDTFCTELIDCLNRFGYQEYICKLCCDKLYPILNKSVYSHRISILQNIIEKINCDCNHEQQNHSIPIDPHSEESKPESWFTKIGTVNKKLLAIGAILLGLSGFAIHGQISQTVDSPDSSSLFEAKPTTEQNLLANEWFNKGRELEDASLYEEAIEAFRNAIQAPDPSRQSCLMCAFKHKGDCEFKLNQINDGIASYELAATEARKEGREGDALWFENEIKTRRK